ELDIQETEQETYITVRRKKQTIFLTVEDDKLVYELKYIIGAIIKESPENQQLYHEGQIMDVTKPLSYYDLSHDLLDPMTIDLSLKLENGEFEPLDVVSYSMPSDLL
ncbi:elongin-B-like isoform X1, partial [Aphis craccivora]